MSLATLSPHDVTYRPVVTEASKLRAVDSVEASFQSGDETALKAVYDAHGSLVYSYCRRALGADQARDTTQEVFLAAWRARDRFDASRGSLPAWLMGITKNKVIDQLRASGRKVPIDDGADVGARSAGPEEAAVLADRMLVADAIRTLPDRARLVVEMAFFDDLTHGEIADRTDLPLGTIKSDIRRGLQKMRRHLEGSS